jgi:hypothetical protein
MEQRLSSISTPFHSVPTPFQNAVETPFVPEGNGVDGTKSVGTTGTKSRNEVLERSRGCS